LGWELFTKETFNVLFLNKQVVFIILDIFFIHLSLTEKNLNSNS